ncbi:MAG: hypothetical protein AAF611_19930 [Bacteroidota bacterium]
MKKHIAYLLIVFLLFNCSEDDTTASLPSIGITAIGDIGLESMTVTSTITSENGALVTERGLCWSTSPNPTTDDTTTSDGTGSGTFTSTMTNLAVNTNYYLRAYAVNSVGVAYSTGEEFGTFLPEVSTNTISSVMPNAIDISAEVINQGSTDLTERGICWGISVNPTINDNTVSSGTGVGSYTGTLTDLVEDTTYYIRAYAVNSLGISYGNEIELNTSLPMLTTTAVTNFTATSAESGGEVTDEGGSSVVAKGVCWSTTPNPTIDDNTTNDGGSAGSFTSVLTGLTANTIYYVRAYATNTTGTSYGNEIEFSIDLPVVQTESVSYITVSTTEVQATVTEEGTASVTERGVCWSTNPNPTTDDNSLANGTGVGTYTTSINGLAEDGVYYIRAYATSSVGTAYGEEIEFANNDCIDTSETYLDNGYITTYLTTQQEVNDFKDTHVHHLYIGDPNGSSDINDLTPLSCVIQAGVLSIKNNPNLTSLAGLENLTRTHLRLEDNPNITSLVGLNNVTNISLTIKNNTNLASFTGLESVATCAIITISDNPNLISFTGLDNVQELVGALDSIIENNNALTDISFPNATIFEAENQPFGNPRPEFIIRNNSSLVSINIPNASSFFFGELKIQDNVNLTSIDMQSLYRTLSLSISGNIELSSMNFTGLEFVIGSHYWDGGQAGALNISDTKLTSMDGIFGTLTASNLNGFIISNNLLLTNLNGMSNVTVRGNVSISNNPLLANLSGPTFFGTSSEGTFLSIVNNDAITHINEFTNYLTNGNLYLVNISDNANLVDIAALNATDCMFGGLKVNNNPSLSNLCPISLYVNGYWADINSQFPFYDCNYQATGNAYNPSAQDIVNGNCSQ